MMQIALPRCCAGSRENAFCIDSLTSKPKKPEPPKPLWPDGSPYVEPMQLTFDFMIEDD